jgi:thioredoxin reductase (NADPH)
MADGRRRGGRQDHPGVTSADACSTIVVKTTEAEYRTKALIIATGASARLLGLPAERTLMGHGVSTCATCDGYFFRGHEIAVVGGGDSAMEEAVFLTRFASKVTVVHRRDTLRASKIMQDKARANPKIAWLLDHEVEAIHDTGKGEVTSMVVRSNKTGEKTEVPVTCVFVAIGHTPNTALFRGQLELDQNGYIVTHDGAKTSVDGVFACGDVQDHIYRQAITAAGSGCMAAIDAEHHLDKIREHLASAVLVGGLRNKTRFDSPSTHANSPAMRFVISPTDDHPSYKTPHVFASCDFS